MIYYVLYNKKLEKYLIHPKIGIWSTLLKEEADQMLLSCTEYVKTINADYVDEFVIIEKEENGN